MVDETKASRWLQRACALTYVVSALVKLLVVRMLLAHLR
jgi:hypothetical protein